MKKLISIFAILSLGFTPKILVKTGALMFINNTVKAQYFTATSNISDSSWSIYKTMSPTSTYGNRYDIVWLNNRGLHLRNKRLFWDSGYYKNSSMVNAKFLWMDSSAGEIKTSKMDSLYKTLNASLSFISNTVSIPAQFNPSAGTAISITGSYPNQTITNSSPDQVVSLTAGNSDISISGSYPSFTITPYIPTTYTVTRSINSATFQPSSTRRCSMVYNALLTSSTSIGGASDAIVLLQYSVNGGTTWLNAPQMENGSTATLALALNLINKQSGVIVMLNQPASTIYRLVPTATNATNTYVVGFETY